VIGVLVDHNIEGQVRLLWETLAAAGWLELVPIRLVLLADVQLPPNSNDRVIWRFAQAEGLLLITDNRRAKGDDSLERTLREEITPTALPVLTVGNSSRLQDRGYRERCATRLMEIVINLETYRGVSRIFIP
jgi:hypothetical protein